MYIKCTSIEKGKFYELFVNLEIQVIYIYVCVYAWIYSYINVFYTYIKLMEEVFVPLAFYIMREK